MAKECGLCTIPLVQTFGHLEVCKIFKRKKTNASDKYFTTS